jgi:hypothetical protein
MTQATKIVILDDEPDRVREMLRCLGDDRLETEVVTFDNAPDMIGWLGEHLNEARLICLDHDLGPNRSRGGEVFDPGTGRDVANFLAEQKPVCPVLIHTTNNLAAPGMAMVLDDSGWNHSRIVPYNDLEWVEEDWLAEVRLLLGKKGR